MITTKRGNKNQKLAIGVTSTLTIANKPDLYYKPQMSSSDFIDLEQFLFNKGFYSTRLNQLFNSVSPAVEIFDQRKNNIITSIDSANHISELKTYDVRKDLENFLYRQKVYQQYGLNFSGGTQHQRYYLSAGYDKNLENLVSDSYNRTTLNASHTFSLFRDRLEVTGDINFISSNTSGVAGTTYSPYTPYDRLADENGNSLPITITSTLRNAYVDTAGNGKLLDWHYRPLDELEPNQNTRINQYRIKGGLNYKITNELNFIANYQYLNETNTRVLNSDSYRYFTRNLINKFSSLPGGNVTRVIPIGNILNQTKGDLISKIFRTQLHFNKLIGTDHEINAIVGYEGSDRRITTDAQTYYGFDPETMLHANATILPLNNYKLYYGTASERISTIGSLSGSIDINQSYFTNASYTYRRRYILSGSWRRDESNLYGVKTNQKGIPLWSVGLAWNISNEDFYDESILPQLKFRATYGYNGNLDKTTSAYLATRNAGTNSWGTPYSDISNPSNPSLRWEKVKTWNFGLDFAFHNNRLNGSFDIYRKDAFDLIGNIPISYQSGLIQYRGNGANLQTKGFDLVLNSNNLTGELKWMTSALLNYNIDKVTDYKVKQRSNTLTITNNYQNSLESYPYYAVFSFPSAGLDATGKLQGYLKGVITSDLGKILNVFDPSLIKYHGSASPKYFGNVINTIGYKNFELSFNINYKLGYYFRRFNTFSGSNYGTSTVFTFELADYQKRWQKSGDELTTRIPALTYPSNGQQDLFYQFSSDLVEKADHIRLQDLKISYNFLQNPPFKLPFKSVNTFVYARDLGVLWRSNKLGIDPDYGITNIPNAFSCSFGINFSL